MRRSTALILTLAALSAGLAHAQQPAAEPAKEPPSKMDQTVDKAGQIATQPARDVGAEKIKIPPILEKATADAYRRDDVKTCRQIGAELAELNDALGTDFDADRKKKENRVGKLAEAGGKTVVNAFIPFRSLIREVSGAAPAERRLNDATDAGYARRGFLRGLQAERRCRVTP